MAAGDDALAAALKMSFGNGNGSKGSFFPAARTFGERDDLLKDAENAFYGGGNAPPQPTPTPTPSAPKPSKMTLDQLYDHFGVQNPVTLNRATNTQPIYMNKPDQQIYDWRREYGWSGGANA